MLVSVKVRKEFSAQTYCFKCFLFVYRLKHFVCVVLFGCYFICALYDLDFLPLDLLVGFYFYFTLCLFNIKLLKYFLYTPILFKKIS